MHSSACDFTIGANQSLKYKALAAEERVKTDRGETVFDNLENRVFIL